MRSVRCSTALVGLAFLGAGVAGFLAAGGSGAEIAHADGHAHSHAVSTASASSHALMHHGVHVLLGAAALVAAAVRRSRGFLLGGGALYVALGVYGLRSFALDALELEPLVHVGVGAAMAGFALTAERLFVRMPSAVPAVVPARVRAG